MAAQELFDAIDRGDDAAVEAFVESEPKLAGIRGADGVSATMRALYRGRAEIAERLAARLPELDVFEAAALGRLDRVLELVGGEPELALARSPDGFTALHYPAFFGRGDAVGVSRTLLEAGADVNARAENAMAVTPLHSAVAGNHADVARLLIDAGADVNARQRHGWTPLHGAARNGAAETVERLLASGADVAIRNDEGVSAADLAADVGHEELAARLR